MILDWERDCHRHRGKPRLCIVDEQKYLQTDLAAKFLQEKDPYQQYKLNRQKLASRRVGSPNNSRLLPKARTETFSRLVHKSQK